MLKNTFCHIPGIGLKSERRLWDRGILSWSSFFDNGTFHERNLPLLKARLLESMERLSGGDPSFFSESLPAKEHWRLFPDFRSSIAYLDIETNGYVGHRGYITAISIYDGSNVRYYIRGENLDDFRRDILDYKVIVTYNGRCFDVPFIESYFNMRLPHAHIDLRFILKDLGFSGGLKGCEKSIGIDRGDLDGLDGYFAVLLWRDFRRNKNPRALETLLAYNIQDVVNLEPLMIEAYNLKIKGTPFENTHIVPAPTAPELPFKADSATIDRLLSGLRNRYETGV